jgi:hypothetical protein
VAAREGWFAAAGLEVALSAEPDGALAALAAGRADVAVDTPLRLLQGAPDGVRAAGCFFETEAGVVLHRDAVTTLFDGDPVQIATAGTGEAADGLARLILRRWAATRGYVVEDEQLVLEPGGADLLQALHEGFDGAFPCHDNREGERARRMGLSAVLVKPEDAGLPNFAGLELFAAAGVDPAALEALREGVGRAVERLEDFGYAQQAWYTYSGEERTPVTDAVVVDTCGRFVRPVRADATRWRPFVEAAFAAGLSALSPAQYEALYAPGAAAAA